VEFRGRIWWQAGEDCIMRSFVICTGKRAMRNSCRILVSEHEGKRPLGRTRGKHKNYTEMDLKQME
jgi:hypothetical protein